MADLTPKERLQPCLLDRLTDDDPRSKSESRDIRVMSMTRYRQAVMRDLSWLLNTATSFRVGELEDLPEVERSVLNYGIPALAGMSSAAYTVPEMEEMIADAVRRYESRIRGENLQVRVERDLSLMSHRSVIFYIEGELWAKPLPENLYLKTEVDLETGQCELSGGAHG